MSRLYMLDTNTVSYVVEGRSVAARAKIRALRSPDIACISSITEAEMRYGLAKKPRSQELRSSIQRYLEKAYVLPWGREEAAAYGILRAAQEAAGTPLPNMDLLIASHAIAVGATLVTNDKTFRQVPSLITINWATDL